MLDKSLTSSAERTKQIQLLIMLSGKMKPVAAEPAASTSGATETSTPSSVNDGNITTGADKPQSAQPPAAAAAAVVSDTALLSFDEKLRAKMNEINVRCSSSKPYNTMKPRN